MPIKITDTANADIIATLSFLFSALINL